MVCVAVDVGPDVPARRLAGGVQVSRAQVGRSVVGEAEPQAVVGDVLRASTEGQRPVAFLIAEAAPAPASPAPASANECMNMQKCM